MANVNTDVSLSLFLVYHFEIILKLSHPLTGLKRLSNLRFYFNVFQGENRKQTVHSTVTFSEMTVRKSGLKRKYANLMGREAWRFLRPSAEIRQEWELQLQVEILYYK